MPATAGAQSLQTSGKELSNLRAAGAACWWGPPPRAARAFRVLPLGFRGTHSVSAGLPTAGLWAPAQFFICGLACSGVYHAAAAPKDHFYLLACGLDIFRKGENKTTLEFFKPGLERIFNEVGVAKLEVLTWTCLLPLLKVSPGLPSGQETLGDSGRRALCLALRIPLPLGSRIGGKSAGPGSCPLLFPLNWPKLPDCP